MADTLVVRLLTCNIFIYLCILKLRALVFILWTSTRNWPGGRGVVLSLGQRSCWFQPIKLCDDWSYDDVDVRDIYTLYRIDCTVCEVQL